MKFLFLFIPIICFAQNPIKDLVVEAKVKKLEALHNTHCKGFTKLKVFCESDLSRRIKLAIQKINAKRVIDKQLEASQEIRGGNKP